MENQVLVTVYHIVVANENSSMNVEALFNDESFDMKEVVIAGTTWFEFTNKKDGTSLAVKPESITHIRKVTREEADKLVTKMNIVRKFSGIHHRTRSKDDVITEALKELLNDLKESDGEKASKDREGES